MGAQRRLWVPMTDEEAVKGSRPNPDDLTWRKQRTAKGTLKAKEQEVVPLPDGPCCFRCAEWRPGTPYGECRQWVVTTGGQPRIERGVALELAYALTEGIAFEPLHTRRHFAGCAKFRDKE